jgi:sialic acid synthase SpsE
MLRNLELSERDFIELNDYCEKKGILFLSTPHSGMDDVDFLESVGISAYKIGSGDLNNLPLIDYISKKGKPIILSTGMATLDEIDEAISLIKNNGNNKIIVLHCTTNYPCKDNETNLNAMQTIFQSTGVFVGYSDHSEDILAPVIAAALGATIIEKHFTLDRKMQGPDHKASLEPKELREMIRNIRRTSRLLGSFEKQPNIVEQEIKKIVRKSLYAKKKIHKGSIIGEDMIAIKRPQALIDPIYYSDLIGKKATKDIEKDQPLSWNLLE